jgi:acyl-CoA ligase (AMP-forming) (exosortase A-associated)
MDFLLHHMLLRSAARYPRKEALVDASQRLTYEESERQSHSLAVALREIGTQRGDRVAIWLDSSVAQAVSIFGISRAGAVFVPINGLLFPDQVAHIVNDCQVKGLITTEARASSLTSVLSTLPSLEFLFVADSEDKRAADLPCYSLKRACDGRTNGDWRDPRVEKDLAAILYTSGSTGKPKGVMLSHGQIMAGSAIVSDYLGITEEERILGALPLSFDAGLNQLTTAIQQGGTFFPLAFVFAREIVQVLLGERITGLAGVPTLWSLLTQPSSSLEKHSFPHLRYITNTGGRMPQSVLAILRRLLPTTRIFLMYGLTEAFRSTYLPPEELDRRPESMGKAIPNTEILVVNEKGEPCKPGEVGELVHRGPTVSMGYWGLPELTAKVLRRHPFLAPELGESEKVCYSGDLVKMDEGGFLYFVARRDNMIKSSGYRVSPTEVEEALFHSGIIREAGVIGIPDMVLGQAIKAFVVPREGHAVEPDHLIQFCAERLPRYMVPKVVEVMLELPKTSTSKVDYPALRRREGVL